MIFRLSLSRIVFRWIHGTEDMAIWRKVVDLDYISPPKGHQIEQAEQSLCSRCLMDFFGKMVSKPTMVMLMGENPGAKYLAS